MNPSTSLLRALRKILPTAEIAVIHERPWYSLTFSGAQICISIALRGDRHAQKADALDRALPSHQFELCGRLVADIAIIERFDNNSETQLLIDALVLDD